MILKIKLKKYTNKMEQEISRFIGLHVAIVKLLLKKANISYFNAITTGKKEYYEEYEKLSLEVEKIYHDKDDFELVKKYKSAEIKDKILKREIELLYNSYWGSQGDIKLLEKIIKLSSKIEKDFNIFRAKIKDKEFTDNEIKDILKKSTDSAELETAWYASKKQAEAVINDLLEIINLRNTLSKSLGFNDYYEMSLELSEQNEQDLTKIFDELDKLTKKPFKNLKTEIDSILTKKYNIKELKPWHYHDLFFQEAPEIYHIDLDKYYENQDIIKIAENYYNEIGLPVSDVLKQSDLYEKPDKYQHACCMDIDREGDIRIVQSTKNNEKWMDTTLHELGHSVYDKFIDKNLPFLLRHPAHIFTTEAIALFFGRNAINPDFIQKYCNINNSEKEKISPILKKIIRMQKLVFSRWSQVMMRFEKELYKNPNNQDMNRLWWSLVKEYQLIDFYRDKPDWASKIHLTSSPVYYHNYLLGELLASQIHHIIKTKDYSGKEMGEFLKNKIFFPGKSYQWDEFVKKATDEPLTAKYFFEEFCR